MEERIINWLCKPKNKSDLILFHHRFPTSTINVRKAAHPFTTGNYFGDTEYVLAHNGVMWNEHKLQKKHTELGITYQSTLEDKTFNDSEALLWDFCLWKEGKIPEMESIGNVAFICLKLHKGILERMYFYRNNNPLMMLRTKDSLQLSSEGEGLPIETDTLYNWSYSSRRLSKKPLEIASSSYKSLSTYGNAGYSPNEYSYDGHTTNNRRDDERKTELMEMREDGSWGYVNIPSHLRMTKKERKAWRKRQKQMKRKGSLSFAQESNAQETEAVRIGEVLRKRERSQLILPASIDTTPVDNSDIAVKYWEYIRKAKGNFEQAYWSAEVDYTLLEDEDYDTEYERMLLDEVMRLIENDPENIDRNSVCSTYADMEELVYA